MPTTTTVNLIGSQEVNPTDIICLKADINYTEIIFECGKRIVIAKSLKELEQKFLPHSFFRTHKSFMVNLNYVVGYNIHEDMVVKLQNHEPVSLSRRRKDDFVKLYREVSKIRE